MTETISAEDLDLTLDEVEEVEDLVGASASEWTDARQGRLMKALVFVLRRRSDPDYTIAMAGKLKMSDLEEALRPTPAGNAPSTE